MTYEEFQAGLAETPELLGTVLEKHESDAIKHLTEGKKMVVTTVDAYATDRQKAIDDTTKKNHSEWEGKLKTIVGEDRPDGVKGLEWLDKLVADKKLIKASKSDDDTSAETRAKDQALKNLQTQIDSLKTNLETEKKGTFTAKVTAEVGSGIRSLKFPVPAHIKDDAQKTAFTKDQVTANTALFNGLYTPEAMADGKVLFKDGKGIAQVDANGDPLTVDGIFAKNHAYLLVPTGKQQGGTGSGDDDDQHKGNADYLGATTEDIRKALSEKGLAMGTNAWADAYNKAHLAAGFRKEDSGAYVK